MASAKSSPLEEVEANQKSIENKYYSKGNVASGQRLREESQKMEIEFNSIMNDLERRRNNKNNDWYKEQLDADYAHMRKNLPGSTTQSLVTKKSQNLVDQREEKTYKAGLAYAESLQPGASE